VGFADEEKTQATEHEGRSGHTDRVAMLSEPWPSLARTCQAEMSVQAWMVYFLSDG